MDIVQWVPAGVAEIAICESDPQKSCRKYKSGDDQTPVRFSSYRYKAFRMICRFSTSSRYTHVSPGGGLMRRVTQKVKEVLLTGAIALVILYFAGFAPGVFHNGAHDLRHAFAIPCH